MINPPPYDPEVMLVHRNWIASLVGEEFALGITPQWIISRSKPEIPEAMSVDLRFFAAVYGLGSVGKQYKPCIAKALVAAPDALDPDFRDNLIDLLERVNSAPPKRRGRPPKSPMEGIKDIGAVIGVMHDVHKLGMTLDDSYELRGPKINRTAQHVRKARERMLGDSAKMHPGRRPKK